MKKPTSTGDIQQTRLLQAKMLPQNGKTGQIKYSSHAKSLRVAKKEVQRATKIESRRRTARCGRHLDQTQQTRTCTSTAGDRVTKACKQNNKQRQRVDVSSGMITATSRCKLEYGNGEYGNDDSDEYGDGCTVWYMDG